MRYSAENLPCTVSALVELRSDVMFDYMASREQEMEQNDDENYSTGNSNDMLSIIRAIDSKIKSIKSEENQDDDVEIDINNPNTYPSLQSKHMTKEIAYAMGRNAAHMKGGVSPAQMACSGFFSPIQDAYKRGWNDAMNNMESQ